MAISGTGDLPESVKLVRAGQPSLSSEFDSIEKNDRKIPDWDVFIIGSLVLNVRLVRFALDEFFVVRFINPLDDEVVSWVSQRIIVGGSKAETDGCDKLHIFYKAKV